MIRTIIKSAQQIAVALSCYNPNHQWLNGMMMGGSFEHRNAKAYPIVRYDTVAPPPDTLQDTRFKGRCRCGWLGGSTLAAQQCAHHHRTLTWIGERG
eukprot:3012389-Rhodomonas_salina.1